jgi:hypothetical protein
MSFLKAIYAKWVKPLWTVVTKMLDKALKIVTELVTKVVAWHQLKLATDPRYAVALVTLGGAVGRILLPLQWVIGFFGDLIREIFTKVAEPRSSQELEAWGDEEDYTFRNARFN